MQCSQTFGLDYNMLNKCTADGEGLNLLAHYEGIHNAAQPRVQGVPAVYIDGKV